MSRGLSSAVKTQLASGSFVMAHLVKLELNTTYYYTDFSSDITDGSDTYSANGFLASLGSITETSTINIGALSLELSGVDQTIISDVLNNGHLHRSVTVKRAILDNSNAIVGSFALYSGFIEGMTIGDSGESSRIVFSTANHWADYERRAGRRTNDDSQQHFFNGDKCFEFADQAGKSLSWGGITDTDIIEGPPINDPYDPYPDQPPVMWDGLPPPVIYY
jgi:hypothetical protein